MNKALGNAISVVILILVFLITGTYILNPEPAEAPMASLIINGSLGLVVLLTIVLVGIVMRDARFSTR